MTPSCILAWACLQVSGGLSYAQPQDDGIYFIQSLPHQLNQTSPSAGFALEGRNWRAGYDYLGRFSSWALVGAANVSGLPPPDGTTDRFSGAGKVHSLFAEYVYRLGSWQLEGGIHFYRATWEESIPSYYFKCGANGNTPGPPWCSIPVNYSSRAWAPGVVVGAGYNVGRATLAFTIRNAPDRGIDTSYNKHDDMPSGVKQYVANFSIRYKF